MNTQALNYQIIRQAASMIPQVRKEANMLVRYAQAQSQPQVKQNDESFLSKMTNPTQYLGYLENVPFFKNLMDMGAKKTVEFLSTGPAKEKMNGIIQNTLLPEVHKFIQKNLTKLPRYIMSPELFVEDFLKTVDKAEIAQAVVQAVMGDNALVSSIASITRPIFSSAASTKQSHSTGRIQKKAFVPAIPVIVAGLLRLGITWFISYIVIKFVWWFASEALWPMAKTALIAIAGYLLYEYFKKQFGDWGSIKDAKSILPFALQSGTQVATYDALKQLADQKSFSDLQKVVRDIGKTKYKIPANVQQELLATKNNEGFKKVLDKHKSELNMKIEETMGDHPGFAGLDFEDILTKVLGLFGGHNSLFGAIFGVLGGLLLAKVLF